MSNEFYEAEFGVTKGWRPIETAPKDGTDILVKGTSKKFGDWNIESSWMDDGWEHLPVGPYYDHIATHWKPLEE